MEWETLLRNAAARGASDVHLEPGHPVTVRVRGVLERSGPPVSAEETRALAARLLPGAAWEAFRVRQSHDLSVTVGGVRCRVNVLKSRRGVGLAVRLFPSAQPTLQTLNLLPDLVELASIRQGLVLVCGPTGAGKSSTIAALLHEINRSEARHVVTIEQPVEFTLRSRQSLVRQREVGRDTPSFEQALVDALREDPDVVMVGEMRDPETMRLTLSAAETGHLVFTTLHSSSVAEGLDRIVTAFPPEIRAGIAGQLAGCLKAAVSQRMTWHEEYGILVPELEILRGSQAALSVVRAGQFFKLQSVMEAGAKDGQWTFERYRRWLAEQDSFHLPAEPTGAAEDEGFPGDVEVEDVEAPAAARAPEPADDERPQRGRKSPREDPNVIILEPAEGSIADILSELDEGESAAGK